jgi:zinc transport system substrate-binding protein
VAALVAAVSLAGCSAGAVPSSGATRAAGIATTARPGGLVVLASFYPLQYVTQRILGDLGTVENLTPSGGEPHDLELTARDVAEIHDAALVVYLSGFQPAVDAAVAGGARALDVAGSARLTRTVQDGNGTAQVRDPHFWLDPTRLAAVTDAVARPLVALRPAAAATFTANARRLGADLAALDREISAGLTSCASRDLVTSHEAFGYFAERYGLTQVGVEGLTPDAEPSPKALARLVDYVRSHDVTTVYYETLVSPDIARTVATSAGVSTAVLDPLEGIAGASAGGDYFSVMRADLTTLRAGQRCS